MRPRAGIAFLFLGETLLIPHLYPIVEALAAADRKLAIDLWVSTEMHEALLHRWTQQLGAPAIRIRRAPGFRHRASRTGRRDPVLPAKLPMLLRLAPYLARMPVVVCAEQTSLWLPRLLPWLSTRFIKTSHGVGSMSARDDPRRRAAFHTLVPSEQERETYLARGIAADRITATGYVKAGFRHRTPARALFPEQRPVLLYTPHWQAHRSSWPAWGAEIVAMLAARTDWNIILAPHQRLIERAGEVRVILDRVAALPHVHCDLDSFAMVDGSYTAMADLYLGDTSSQLMEYLIHPRPAIFLDPASRDWQGDPAYAMWHAGQVVQTLADLPAAIDGARAAHGRFAEAQRAIAHAALGDASGAGAQRAAAGILRILNDAAPGRGVRTGP